jgi:hypothetical protein
MAPNSWQPGAKNKLEVCPASPRKASRARPSVIQGAGAAKRAPAASELFRLRRPEPLGRAFAPRAGLCPPKSRFGYC